MSYIQASGGGRTLLTADANRYFSNAGSDSNDGLTPATAWATLQHGMDVISSTIDGGGIFNVFMNVAAGSYVGVGIKPCVGIPNLLWEGAGSGTCTITTGPNDGVFNVGECFSTYVPIDFAVFYQGFTLHQTTFGIDCLAAGNGQHFLFDLSPNPADIVVSVPATGVFQNNFGFGLYGEAVLVGSDITAHGANQNTNGLFNVTQGGRVNFGGTITFPGGSPTYNVGFAQVADFSVIGSGGGVAFSGSYIGPSLAFITGGGIFHIGGTLPSTTGIATGREDFRIVEGIVANRGQKSVTSQFDKTTDTSLATITGLSVPLVDKQIYTFRACLHVSPDAVGGHKYAIGTPDTLTATSIIYQVNSINNSTNANIINSRQTALGGAVGVAGGTVDYTEIIGTIEVNAAGTLAVQFAQNASNGTSSVLVGSTLCVDGVTGT